MSDSRNAGIEDRHRRRSWMARLGCIDGGEDENGHSSLR